MQFITPDITPRVSTADDKALALRLQHTIDFKTKPLGALGQLEALALQLGSIGRAEQITLHAPQMVVFAVTMASPLKVCPLFRKR